jgi:hypothetical protein
MLGDGVDVFIYHRRELPGVWAAAHRGQALPASARWSFRAWARGPVVRIFVDATETPASVAWVLLYELAHVELGRSRYLASGWRSQAKPADYLIDDDVHEAWPEEKVANMVATSQMPVLGYQRTRYDRYWWRGRVRQRLWGRTVVPDS